MEISKRRLFISSFLCALLLCVPSLDAATVDLVTNGSFELGNYKAKDPDFNTLNQGSTAIEGWTVFKDPNYGNIDWVGTYWTAQDGKFSIDLNGSTEGRGGGIQQTINTTAGQQYKLGFWLSGNPDGGPAIKPLIVLGIGSDLFDVPYYEATVEASKTNMDWTMYEYIFTAGLSQTVLTFLSQTTGYYGPVIDNVSISAVPLPAAAWMLGAGMIGLVAVRRRRK